MQFACTQLFRWHYSLHATTHNSGMCVYMYMYVLEDQPTCTYVYDLSGASTCTYTDVQTYTKDKLPPQYTEFLLVFMFQWMHLMKAQQPMVNAHQSYN